MGKGAEHPTPSPSTMTMHQLMARAAETDQLKAEIDQLRRQLMAKDIEIAHWRNAARDHGWITEKDYERLTSIGH